MLFWSTIEKQSETMTALEIYLESAFMAVTVMSSGVSLRYYCSQYWSYKEDKFCFPLQSLLQEMCVKILHIDKCCDGSMYKML